MTTDSPKLQPDPAEGSRERIERELDRKGLAGGKGEPQSTSQGKQNPENKRAMDEAAPQTGTRPGP
jgi:hypothetical protein